MSTKLAVGKGATRLEGRAKVTGQARYSAEYPVEGLLHGYVLLGSVVRGRIVSIDSSRAEAVEGVVKVFTHLNSPPLNPDPEKWRDGVAPKGEPFRPLQTEKILYGQQPVALVVGESFEVARYASRLVEIDYEEEAHCCDFEEALGSSYPAPEGKMGFDLPPETRGTPEENFAQAPFRVHQSYSTPSEHHNPMEPHATIAKWQDDRLTVWTKTQGVSNSKEFLAAVFELEENQVQVISPYVGGAFGSGLRPQYQVVLAAQAAKVLQRPVKVVLTRPQMFSFGHRPAIKQEVKLSAGRDGKLTCLSHKAWSATSRFEHFTPTIVNWGGSLYATPHATFEHYLVPMDIYTPLDMRAPGGATGMHALECAMDELAYLLGMDPLEFRLVNYAERDHNSGNPYSSKELRACYQQAAQEFGWSERRPEPGSQRRGELLIGWGMASGIWEVMFMECTARVSLGRNGRLQVDVGSSDIGPGTYTVAAQMAGDILGVSADKVRVTLGDTSLPKAPLQGGSMTAASVGCAVAKASRELAEKVRRLAREHEVSVDFPLSEILRKTKTEELSHTATSSPEEEKEEWAKFAHSTAFVEVEVHPRLGTLRVTRMVLASAAGRILNPVTAGSQVLGSAVWGVGMGLLEESVLDPVLGRFINHDLAEYHVPVNADIPDTRVLLVPEEDPHVNPLGVKGIGEVGMVGVSAAIANAIFHATGKRVRSLPITLDKVL